MEYEIELTGIKINGADYVIGTNCVAIDRSKSGNIQIHFDEGTVSECVGFPYVLYYKKVN